MRHLSHYDEPATNHVPDAPAGLTLREWCYTVTCGEAARILRKSRSTIYNAIRSLSEEQIKKLSVYRDVWRRESRRQQEVWRKAQRSARRKAQRSAAKARENEAMRSLPKPPQRTVAVEGRSRGIVTLPEPPKPKRKDVLYHDWGFEKIRSVKRG